MAKAREAFLRLARQRFQQAAEAEAKQRQAQLEDKEFRAGKQWPDQVQAARMIDQRPCLVIDKLSGPIRQITNAQRQSRFGIDVLPVGDGAAQETAEVFQGLVRHIEVESQAQVAYAWAFEDAVTSGRGWWRVLTDYAGDDTFDQDLKIRRILNPFCVYLDPSAEEPDGSDARYAFVIDDVPKDEYRQRFPNSQVEASLEAFASVGDRSEDWYPEGKIRIAEYWWREPKPRRLAQLADGRTVSLEAGAAEDVEGVPIQDTRDVDAWTVKWALINATEVLDERDWPGKYIPLVPVTGEELNVAGERIYRGLVRSARDSQRMYNYWVSAETEAIALAPRAPFVGVEGQFEGHEAQWKQSNLRSFPYLEYKPTSIAGVPSPPPQRQVAEPPIQALVMAVQQADNDIKATTGLFDPSLGNINSKERSGRAIQALQRQGEQANSNYVDNLARAITHTGRILVDLIPTIYDRPGRIVRILGADEQAKSVALNAPFVPGPQGQPQLLPPQAPPPPQAKTYNLREGRYAVRVQVGQSYNTRRQETVANMMDLLGANAAMWPLIGDLVFAEMDWPGAKPVSERLKKMLPPQLQDDQQQAPIPPQVQQQLQQAGQMIDALTARVNELTQARQLDEVKASKDAMIKRMEIESRERIAAMQVQADLVKTEATLNLQQAQTLLTQQVQANQHLLGLQYERVQGMEQQALAADQAEQDQAGAAEEAEAQRAHERDMTERQQAFEATSGEAQRAHEATLAAQQAQAKAAAPAGGGKKR